MMKRILAFLMVLCMSIYLVPLEALALDAAYAAYQDELCAAGLCTHVDQARKTAKGELHWSGGDPNCDHYQYKWTWKWVYEDKEYHVETATCTHCGAQGKTNNKQKHEWETSELSPGGPQYPEGGTIYYCPICEYEYVVPNGSCKHKHTTKKWDETNHWDECDDCHAHLNVKGHKQGKLQKDDSKHWYACTGCGARLEEGAHVAQYWKHSNDEHWKTCWCGVEVQGTRGPHNPEWDYDDSKHWQTCECGWESKATKHTLEDHQLPDGTVEHACTVCPFKTTSTLPDLSQRRLTNVKSGDDPEYSSSEIKKVGLEGLKEGKDYTAEITTQNNDDGSQSWVKTFEPIEGKSTGEKTFRAKKKGGDVVEGDRYYELTVIYKAADAQYQSRMPAEVHRNYKAGKSYDVPVPIVAGFAPDRREVHGVMPKENLTITVTYTRMFELTIYLIYPYAEAEEGEEGQWHETFVLPDGAEYNYPISELLEASNLSRDASSAGDMFSDMALSMQLGVLMEVLGQFTPDKDPVQGKIEGANKEETVRFTCTHPEGSYSYDIPSGTAPWSTEGHGTHIVSCGLCGAVIKEEEPCEYTDTFLRVSDFNEGFRADYPNGAYKRTCAKCRDAVYVSADEEVCPGSSSGEPHDWTEWTKLDEEHCHRTCNRCDKEVTQVHPVSKWTNGGGLYHVATCMNCHASLEEAHHNWFVFEVIQPATETTPAIIRAKCGVCGAYFARVPDAILPEWYQAHGGKD